MRIIPEELFDYDAELIDDDLDIDEEDVYDDLDINDDE